MSLPTCVIYNSAAGRGRAINFRAELESRSPPGTEFFSTKYPGHASQLAAEAIARGFVRVVAAGGDGTAHEVANGILSTHNRDVRFAVLPAGSMNDYAFTLGMIPWWKERRGWDELRLIDADVGELHVGDQQRYFINGCGLGFNGMVTVEARQIRWLRGLSLYSLAVLKALLYHFQTPTLELQIDGRVCLTPTLAFSIGLGQREGGFPLTALARLDDQLFDILHVADIARWELLRHFPGMITGRLPINHPKLQFKTGRSIRVRSQKPLCIHADGELVCVPIDEITEMSVRLLPGRLKVETYSPGMYGGTQFDSIRQMRSQPTPSQHQPDISENRSD